MAKRKYYTEDVLCFLDSNLSDIEEFTEADDEVEDNDWTPMQSMMRKAHED